MTTDLDLEYDLEAGIQALVNSGPGPATHPIKISPWQFYAQLRARSPIHYSPSLGMTFVTSFAASRDLVREPAWSRRTQVHRYEDMTAAQRAFLSGFAFQDPPEHTRLRAICAAVFTPRAVERQRPVAASIVDKLLADVRQRDSFDFLGDFAYNVPEQLIGTMLGIPQGHRKDFIRWSMAMSRANEPSSTSHLADAESQAASAEIMAFFTEFFAYKRANPGDDMTSQLLQLSDESTESISDAELISTVVMLYQGGLSTTANLLANSLFTLMSHPDSYSDLRADPSLAESATEEVLRFESPSRNTLIRTAPNALTLHDHQFEAGDRVYAILGAANRDPDVFEDPDTFVIRRNPKPRHIAFGGGIHVCLGTSLARIEAQEVLHKLAAEHPRLQFGAEEALWLNSFVHRRLISLPVEWA